MIKPHGSNELMPKIVSTEEEKIVSSRCCQINEKNNS